MEDIYKYIYIYIYIYMCVCVCVCVCERKKAYWWEFLLSKSNGSDGFKNSKR